MRLFCKCGNQLTIKHEIVLEVISNFTSIGGRITITKHHLQNTKGTQHAYKESEVKNVFCNSCEKLKDLEDAYIKCDNCGGNVPRDTAKRFGDTILLCPRCINSCKSFDVFKVFGNRGPTPQTRATRISEAIDGAREVRPEIPSEIFDFLDTDETEESNDDLPFEGPEVTIRVNSVPEQQTPNEGIRNVWASTTPNWTQTNTNTGDN